MWQKENQMIKVKRVYEPASGVDGFRILVDRLWPRALSRDKAQADLWLKEISPSHKLRKWYAHDPQRWQGFKKEYRKELTAKKELVRQIKRAEKENGVVTLLFAAKDAKRNNAVLLKEFVQES